MRTFYVDMTNEDMFFTGGRTFIIKANTLKGVFRKIRRRQFYYTGNILLNEIYQIRTRVRGCSLYQPIWNYYSGRMDNYFGLKL